MRCAPFAIAALCLVPAAAPAQTPITIKAARVLDGKGGMLANAAVVVQGTKIVRIETNPRQVTYDLGDATLMPGWIDTHVHIGNHFDRDTGRMHSAQSKPETPEQAAMYLMENAYNVLMSGFTTIQSPGAEIDRYLRDTVAKNPAAPGPRTLTSLRSVNDRTGSPDEIRAFVRKVVADGADFIKVFATKSIREGGAQTLTDEQLVAACGEAKALGKRAIVHAQGPEGAKAAILAGCTAIEHGNRLTDEVLDLMVKHGTYFDSNNHLLLHNYIDNKPHYLGIGNYNEEGFAYLAKGLPIGNDTFQRALKKKVKMVFGTDGMPGAIGREYEELIYRVKDGGQAPMDAIVDATSHAAESMGLGSTIGTLAPGFEADLVATPGDVTKDITTVRKAMFVMRGGIVFKNVAPSTMTAPSTKQ